jgi:predicted lipid-binding transport protein (Tim44 family)
MGLIDLIVMVLVIAVVLTRFTKFKLPTDPRDKAARRADIERLRERPLLRDEAPAEMAEEPKPAPRKPSARELQEAAKGLSGLAKVKALEPGFHEADFLEGAKAAYGYFYTCWNARDEEGLDNLCAPALHGRLLTQLQDDRVWEPVAVDEITLATLGDARVHGKTAVIDVHFETVERMGDSAARPVQRTWVLARPLGSEDPNWELQDIRTTTDA